MNSGAVTSDEDHAEISVWDFGGQFVFYTTHQMFLSSRAIYILVNNMSQNIDDIVNDDETYFDCSGSKSLKIEGKSIFRVTCSISHFQFQFHPNLHSTPLTFYILPHSTHNMNWRAE